ncbi:MAG TPA: hypothetical protein VJZ00_24030, partial [Thermoanaerobaculia bacterium]|nr:hypothetical protein [Thermoanaerobaculia bacterium]
GVAAAPAAAPVPSQDVWVDQLAEYKRRKAAAVTRAMPPAMGVGIAPGAPAIPGGRNWSPLGPSVVTGGQAKGRPSVGGRISGIAVAAGGQIVYAASANGGVFRSDDAGQTWKSLMDAFDVDPTNFASTSLACGAIAVAANDPNRVFVGTGEGDTHQIFANRITNALPAYRGIGPIRTDDGGANWESEPTAAVSSQLAGKAFFALAIDPANAEHVLAATTEGVYERQLVAGAPQWTRRRQNVHSSVIATTASGGTRFYAAEWGKGVFRSANGQNWTAIANGFPATGVGRIALAAQPNNPRVVYAFVAKANGAARGLFRLDVASGAWKTVANLPDVLPVDGNGGSQGDYDLAIAVDPLDDSIVYLGGSYFNDPMFWPGSIWRCNIAATGASFKATGTSIGENAHADVHVLTHTPGDANQLWAGCDGGLFLNRNPRADGTFAPRNTGLSCLCPNFIAQHPTDPHILFAGLQDNGTARTGGGPAWKWVNGGDGGYCLVNWNDPKQVLIFANGTVYRSTTGGETENSWTQKQFPWMSMTEPIVGTPYKPSSPNDAKTVALGVGNEVQISNNFGQTWSSAFTIAQGKSIFALAFASPTRIFAGTTKGEVYRAERTGNQWTSTRIDNVAAGPLGLQGLVSDIAIDWSDATLQSIYLTFGGMGDARHVWHFDGTRWSARSGAPGSTTNLLDVEHNALVVDATAPQNLYVGADIGVWHSGDSGATWEPLSNGLPDAPVFDLQIHPTQRLLRAATHGRGVYELAL